MGRQEIKIEVRTSAGPAAVYALLTDGATWPSWTPLGTFELERSGEGATEGVGAIRVFRTRFRTGPVVSREQVAELVPDRRFGYALLSGMPLKGYRANVDLTPTEGGTTIRWHSTFDARVVGTGWFYRRVLAGFIRQCAEGLAEYAARPTGNRPDRHHG